MRTREEIRRDDRGIESLILEVLLDIRDLLDKIETDTIAIRDRRPVYGENHSLWKN